MIALRPGRIDDAPALSAIHGAAFDEGWSEADLAGWLGRADAFVVVADREREAIAFGLALTAGDGAELLTIASHPLARRAGAGRAIFRELDAIAGRRGLSRWVLEAARNNDAALGLYRGEGFMEIGVRKDYYRQVNGRVDAIVMARPAGGRGRESCGQAGD